MAGETSYVTQARAKALHDRAREALAQNNLDYAIDLFHQALDIEPGSVLYRQGMRAAQRMIHGNDPARVGKLAGVRIPPLRMRARSEKNKGHAERALKICEDAFKINPWDVGTARVAAEAAESLQFKALACWLMESVAAQAGEDADYLRHLAEVYKLNGQYQKAIACLEKVRKLDPSDEFARREINALSASATIVRAGLNEAIGKNDPHVEVAVPEVEGLEDLKAKPETPEHRYLREISEEPTRIGPYLNLADLYRSANKLDEAEKILARGRKSLPADELLRSSHAEIQILRLKRAIAHWKRKLEADPDDIEAQEKLSTLRGKADAYQLNELKHKVKVQPADMSLRLELGKALAAVGQHDEAIAEFQQARGNPALRTQALYLAGQSFESKNLAKLAERNYQEALKLAEADDPTLALALHYRLGRVAELQGDRASAEEHYNEVAANDYTYLDVAERLRALNQPR